MMEPTKSRALRTLLGVVLVLLTSRLSDARVTIPPGFVFLRDIAPGIAQDIRYAGGNNFTGGPLPGYHSGECVLRRPVALALKQVQDDLARNHLSLKVYDCYRPTRAVTAMAHWAADQNPQIDTRSYYPNLPKNRLFALGYISNRSAHSRGVAVDLTIVPLSRLTEPAVPQQPDSCAGPLKARAPDNSLDMGTTFDCFDPRSATRHPSIGQDQRANRQILLGAMTRHGFSNYHREWWHFSFPSADTRIEFDFPIERR
jgi:D-alanyl-D-alanine dipeptidase